MAGRRGGWASLIALVVISCRSGTSTETARGAATAAVQIGAETSVDQPAYRDRQGTQVGGAIFESRNRIIAKNGSIAA